MERYTIEQRVKIIQAYYENGCSNQNAYRALRAFFGQSNRPNVRTIGKIVKKFEQTGSVEDVKTPVHARTARSAENIAAVRDSVTEEPSISTRRRAQQLHLSRSSLMNIMHKDLHNNNNNTDKPKHPLSAYMIWLNSAREGLKKEHPGIKDTEILKKCGEIWLGMKDKSDWEAKAAKAKEDYEDAVKEFEANGGSTANGGGAAKKRGKAAKKVAKKSKKADSDDDEDDESE